MSGQGSVDKVWAESGPFLQIGIFALTAYQMAWTGWTYVTKTATYADKAVICILCVLLLLLGNWLVANIRRVGLIWRAVFTVIIIGIMAASIITSQLHFSSMFIGGFSESIRDGDLYQRATTRYELAINELEGAQESAAIADAQGKVGDAGYIRRKQVTSAKNSVIAAQAELDKASKPSDLGDSKTTAMAKTSRFFKQDPTSFITLLWLFVAALLEFGRMGLALASSSRKADAVDVDLGNAPAAQ